MYVKHAYTTITTTSSSSKKDKETEERKERELLVNPTGKGIRNDSGG